MFRLPVEVLQLLRVRMHGDDRHVVRLEPGRPLRTRRRTCAPPQRSYPRESPGLAEEYLRALPLPPASRTAHPTRGSAPELSGIRASAAPSARTRRRNLGQPRPAGDSPRPPSRRWRRPDRHPRIDARHNLNPHGHFLTWRMSTPPTAKTALRLSRIRDTRYSGRSSRSAFVANAVSRSAPLPVAQVDKLEELLRGERRRIHPVDFVEGQDAGRDDPLPQVVKGDRRIRPECGPQGGRGARPSSCRRE